VLDESFQFGPAVEHRDQVRRGPLHRLREELMAEPSHHCGLVCAPLLAVPRLRRLEAAFARGRCRCGWCRLLHYDLLNRLRRWSVGEWNHNQSSFQLRRDLHFLIAGVYCAGEGCGVGGGNADSTMCAMEMPCRMSPKIFSSFALRCPLLMCRAASTPSAREVT
jgi:hypothetical protein